MANKSRFIIAESRIKSFFKEGNRKAYTKEQIRELLDQNRILWNLPQSMFNDRFIEKLITSGILEKKEFIFDGFISKKERFLISDATIFQIAVSLINKSYLSHFTAVFLHGLTNQIPKTIYVSFEQSKKNFVNRALTQEAINSAFSKPQRKSITTSIYEGYKFLIHNGMYSNRLGVYSLNDLPITNIERTLIDITVRPSYAGGVDSVLDIYRRSLDKISINKLVAILNKLDFIYPYHQSIGFYLEKAGCDEKKLETFNQFNMQYDFYLDNEISESDFDKRWRIYYPRGI